METDILKHQNLSAMTQMLANLGESRVLTRDQTNNDVAKNAGFEGLEQVMKLENRKRLDKAKKDGVKPKLVTRPQLAAMYKNHPKAYQAFINGWARKQFGRLYE